MLVMATMMITINRPPRGTTTPGFISNITTSSLESRISHALRARDVAGAGPLGRAGHNGARRTWRRLTPAHAPLQQNQTDHDQQHRPELGNVFKNVDAQIIEQEQGAQSN